MKKWLSALLLFFAYNAYAGPHVILYYACSKVVFAHFEANLPEGIIVMGDVTPEMFATDDTLRAAIMMAEQDHPEDYPNARDITEPLKQAGLLVECPIEG
jgi:hypothetical protein